MLILFSTKMASKSVWQVAQRSQRLRGLYRRYPGTAPDHLRNQTITLPVLCSQTREPCATSFQIKHTSNSLPMIHLGPPSTLLLFKNNQSQLMNLSNRLSSSQPDFEPHHDDHRDFQNRTQLAAYHLKQNFPQLLNGGHKLELYAPNVVFEDRINGLQVHGLSALKVVYSTLRNCARLWLHDPFMELLSIEAWNDQTVHIRWRVVGLSRATRFGECWLDAYSIFHVDEDGRISRHVMDKYRPTKDGHRAIEQSRPGAWWMAWC
eukprot:TRINITY_DN9107_c0_g1_i1.p1 TRINITY_DN9107_c0_g1~~TRINITY_DN9107_c0_g1_i1.p1  ORF type:complete len:263 (+),score=3.61 TRINITY_DN9107_c0_g1_i1:400-1188(+)